MVITNYILAFFSLLNPTAITNDVCVSEKEKELFDIVNEYRKKRKLDPIPFSPSLTKVSQAHVNDLVSNYKFDPKAKCNPHSWSKKGDWTSCCYTDDHKKAECMWYKPREIAGYDSEGFEILYYSSNGIDPKEALEGWKASPGHHPLIINTGQWGKVEWKSMGIGIKGEYAVIWFGRIDDTSNQLKVCK